MDYLKSISPSIFPELPEHSLSLETLPASLSFINAAAYYILPPVDDYTNNIIRVNPAVSEGDPSLVLTLAHEGYGGHLLEFVYHGHRKTGKLRQIMDNIGFNEGFAQYASGQLLRASDFDETLVDYIVNASAFSFYLDARIEIGIFYEGWIADDIAEFLRGLRDYFEDMDDEIAQEFYEFYYASKNVFIRYGVGEAFFYDLRKTAEAKQGDNFDAKEFHTLILDIGACPLNILAETIDDILDDANDEPEPDMAA
jgi:uncharacterized protein (DUF885 family)